MDSLTRPVEMALFHICSLQELNAGLRPTVKGSLTPRHFLQWNKAASDSSHSSRRSASRQGANS